MHYRLAVSNVFVEKAQYHLEERAKSYRVWGVLLYGSALSLFAVGAVIAICKFVNHERLAGAGIPTREQILQVFLLASTAYGFLVLTGVACARGAQACFDQRERLLAKRHSLRQGRLYLQLKGGNVTIEELDRAFNWNYDRNR